MNLLVGLLAGLFGGLVGLGGGVVMIPLLVRLRKLGQHQAHGTSLVALVFTGLAGALAYGLQGTVDLAAAALIAATAVVTARWGAQYAHSLPEWMLKRAFGGFLLAVSLLMLSKPYLPTVAGTAQGWQNIAVLLLTGTAAGFLSGMMGVGGGTIMVPAMVLLAGFSQHLAQGSALLAMVPAGGAGAWTHGRLGNVRLDLLRGLVPGILAGAYLGGTLAHRFTDRGLRMVFAAVLIWTGLRYLRTKQPAHP